MKLTHRTYSENFLSKRTFAQPLTLRSFAEAQHLSMNDVAVLSGIHKSTISRLWTDAHWLDRITGSTLQKLIEIIPYLGTYVVKNSTLTSLMQLIDECQDYGITFDEVSLKSILDKTPVQYVISSLHALIYILRQDAGMACNILGRLWGAKTDIVTDELWKPHSLLLDQSSIQKLYHATEGMIDSLKMKNSVRETITLSMLTHKMAKYTNTDFPLEDNFRLSQHEAFFYRAKITGLAFDDQEIVEFYANQMDNSRLLLRNELWSLLAFAGDIPISSHFLLPKETRLVYTSNIILHDLETTPVGYQFFLVLIAIPLLLKYDPRFGGKRDELKDALNTLVFHTRDEKLISATTHLEHELMSTK